MIVLDVLFWLFCGCAGAAAAALVMGTVIGLIAFGEWVRDRLSARDDFRYECFQAQQEIHNIRRRAIREMLHAEHCAHDDPHVIEGTAVEVRP